MHFVVGGLNLVRDRTDKPTSALLTQLPKDAKNSYLERFQLPIWRDVLIAVRKAVGPRFRGVLNQFNTRPSRSAIAKGVDIHHCLSGRH
jgi:hypothetical protein